MACEETINTIIEVRGSSLLDYQSGAAGTGVNVLMEAFNGHTSSINASFSQSANQHPSPYSRQHTSTVRTNNDRIDISGWVRCVVCSGPNSGREVDFTDYAAKFKKLMEVQQYTRAELATIYCPIGTFRNMRLADFNCSIDGETAQELQLFSTWEAMNVAGDMRNPAWASGGLQT